MERPNPFRPLFAGRRRATVNMVLVVLATGSLFAFAVQLGGRRRWVLFVALCVTVFCAFLYSWPVFGTRRAYACTPVVGIVFAFPVFAIPDSQLQPGILPFLMLACMQGVSGLLPKFIAGHFPTETRAASLGFTYNVGALGGAVAPVPGARLASTMSLGQSLAVLTFAEAVVPGGGRSVLRPAQDATVGAAVGGRLR